jgi:acetyltransferase
MLEQTLVRFSQFVCDQSWVREVEINPLVVHGDTAAALDARIILHDLQTPAEHLPRPAIRPYPAHLVSRWKSESGRSAIVRPIRPEDEPLMVEFHRSLSPETVYLRYFGTPTLDERIAHQRLTRICFNDYDREIALVAEVRTNRKNREIIGVARLSKAHGLNEAEFAIVIRDDWQGRGLGTFLLRQLIRIAREEKLDRLTACILPENHPMLDLSRRSGFSLHFDAPAGEWLAELQLTPTRVRQVSCSCSDR